VKRRLRLLPEVLPDPTPHYPNGAPRSRTLAHLDRLRKATLDVSATATWREDETGKFIEARLAAKGATFPDAPPPYGFGASVLRIVQSGEELVLRVRPQTDTVSVVVHAVAQRPTRVSLQIKTEPLSIRASEVPA
jgi:hypothetical protein